MDYTQLTDDELRRKVLELMGYSAYILDDNYKVVEDDKRKITKFVLAPDYLNDANAYMGLVDEMRKIGKRVNIQADKDGYTVYFRDNGSHRIEEMLFSGTDNPGRAICEVFCQVKEQK